MLVDALTANLEFDVLNQSVTDRVDQVGRVAVEFALEPHVGDEITVAADGASYTIAEGGVAVEGLFDGLHGKVGVAAVDHLEERNFGFARKEHVLGTVGDELHKSSSHFLII